MRPAHCAREVRGVDLRGRASDVASMRPAHCAREVTPTAGLGRRPISRFNEARALCAGSSREAAPKGARAPSFNEARALCAGSWAACAFMQPSHILLQ